MWDGRSGKGAGYYCVVVVRMVAADEVVLGDSEEGFACLEITAVSMMFRDNGSW